MTAGYNNREMAIRQFDEFNNMGMARMPPAVYNNM